MGLSQLPSFPTLSAESEKPPSFGGDNNSGATVPREAGGREEVESGEKWRGGRNRGWEGQMKPWADERHGGETLGQKARISPAGGKLNC